MPTDQDAAALPVAILMAVYDGAAYLQAQLDSIAAQSHHNWRLLASDDGSHDDSRIILARFAARHPSTVCLDGPQQGGTENFMSMLRALPDHVAPGTWVAFCDQDDVWLPERLERGLAALRDQDPACPALYCSRTFIADEGLGSRRLSAPRPRPLGFRNALVQNVASGNTILLNPAAAELAVTAARETRRPVVHDWWLYQLIAGTGGTLVHDDMPSLLYRQHGINQIGANDGTRARMKRIGMLLRGSFREWNDINLAALRCSAHRLTAENRQLLERFDVMRRAHLLGRLRGMRKLALYRQSTASTVALWLAAVFRHL